MNMRKGTGIQLTDNCDIDINVKREGGSLITSGIVIGDTLRQNQAIILAMNKGELKEAPLMGVGICDMLLDDDPLYWRTEIREQMEMDGQRVENVSIGRESIEITAEYPS